MSDRPTAIVTRFAPSPTGWLHLGHAFSAEFAWRKAREAGGRFLLRMDDIDQQRCRPEYEATILDDLTWFGLDWDGPVLRQSTRLDRYRSQLDRLSERGLTYPCFCTRKEIRAEISRSGSAPHGADGPIYPGLCRHLTDAERTQRINQGKAYAVRLDIARAMAETGPLTWNDRTLGTHPVRPERIGDPVLARKDYPASYHLSIVLDDHDQQVTLVTRGLDLAPSTPLHRVLQALLGLAVPDYHHHDLLADETGRRLAKRDQARSLQSLRADGLDPAAVRALIAEAPRASGLDPL